MKIPIIRSLLLICSLLLWAGVGCHSDQGGPKELLDTFFTSAIRQDYAETYTCYYKAYQAKVTKEDFIRHRKEAAVLMSYRILSLSQAGDTAAAQVVLTFGSSEKLKRKEPATVTVTEDMVRENGIWKIKVW